MREVELAQARANELGVVRYVYRSDGGVLFTSPVEPDRMHATDLIAICKPEVS